MITERGTIKTSTNLDEKLYIELNGKLRKQCIAYIIIGALLAPLGILGLGVDIYKGEDITSGTVVLAAGVAIIFLGIFFLIYYKNFNRAAVKMNRVEEVEFFNGYLMEYEYTDGELTSTNKVYYKWLLRIRETKSYLFLYNTRVTAIAVDKNALPLSELNTIRMLLGRPVAGGTQVTVQPPVQTPEPTASDSVEPAEPFTDITDNKEE
ncbi:MAG: YcxB family protein [Clostridia bacterium]|nr:YcxB family protein [Clostridia bacterium]